MNSREKKAVESLKSAAKKVINFYSDSVVTLLEDGDADNITVDMLNEVRDISIKSFKKGIQEKSSIQDISLVVSYIEKCLNTLISKSNVKGLDYVHINDFKKSTTLVLAANELTVTDKNNGKKDKGVSIRK